MDVVPDGKDFLSAFVTSLGVGEGVQAAAAAVVGESVETSEGVSDNVWIDIEEALHRWTGKILDAERRYEKTTSFRENIEASLRRQQLDGF